VVAADPYQALLASPTARPSTDSTTTSTRWCARRPIHIGTDPASTGCASRGRAG
jgi:hypothetical protein